MSHSAESAHDLWTRRSFLAASSLSAAALSLQPRVALGWETSSPSVTISGHARLPSGTAAGLTIASGSRTCLHVTTHSPVALTAHPSLPVVYAATVGPEPAILTAYRVDPLSLALHPLGTQSLSLAATNPAALAVTADARSLVTLDQRGLLNIHPLLKNGTIAPVTHTRRLTGAADMPGSLPHITSLVLHPAASLALVADSACRRIVPIDLNGPDGPAFHPAHTFAPGFRPATLALHPSRRLLAVGAQDSSFFATLRLGDDASSPSLDSPTFHTLPRDHRIKRISFSADGSVLTLTANAGSAACCHAYTVAASRCLYRSTRRLASAPQPTCTAVLTV